MEFFQKILKKSGWISILESIIFIILGFILVFNPEGTIKFISYVLGAIFIIIGLFKIMSYFGAKGKNDFYNYDIIYGILAIVIAIITIVYSSTIASLLRIIIGVWIIYTSLVRFSSALRLRQLSNKIWVYSLILAFVMFVCGLFIALNPGVITTTIGIIMIVYSIIDIAETIILMKNLKDVF